MRHFIYFILLFFIMGCESNKEIIDDRSEEDFLSDRIIIETAKKLKKEKGLELVGMGGGEDKGKIWLFKIRFEIHELLDIKKARELMVYAVEKYLTAINSNLKMRPYLRDYPSTIYNLNIAISSIEKQYKFPHSPHIALALLNGGNILYFIDDDPVLKKIHSESYDDAKKIVNEEQKQ